MHVLPCLYRPAERPLPQLRRRTAAPAPARGHRPRRQRPVTVPVQQHSRVHLDLYAGDAADQAAGVARLVALGAERVDWDRYSPGPGFVVLTDTDGNRFCVIDTGGHA
jgi:glyoxalase superfamily protein